MASCLGLYIQDNLIKYAKVTRDKDNIKVETFGVKSYDNIKETIDQIVAETYSYSIPISVNLANENYNYFYLFSLLSKNDIKKSIETEFDSMCHEQGQNRNTLETRYALVPDVNNTEKIKVIHVSNNKIDLNRKIQQVGDHKLAAISPLPIAIANLVQPKSKENCLVINIENKTTVTTILDQKIYNVDVIDEGADTFLNSINEKENSYSKAYEICKNTTIYTMEGRELQSEENEYLQDIMPVLYNIVQEIRKIIDLQEQKIEKIYITGTGAIINNIDLYFQEYFTGCKCEILKPYFISDNVKINMKDYIEVNSAIALGMQGLEYGVRGINFKALAFSDRLPDWLKVEIKGNKGNNGEKKKINFGKKVNFSGKLNGALDNSERWLVRAASAIFAFVLIYCLFAGLITGFTNKRIKDTDDIKQHTESQIALVQADISNVEYKTTEYEDLLETIKNLKNEKQENKKVKNSVPNFLTSLMYAVPKGVSIRSVTNTSGYTMRVIAQSKQYSQLAYLIGSMKTTGMLYDVNVSASVKNEDIITVVIEGNLFP